MAGLSFAFSVPGAMTNRAEITASGAWIVPQGVAVVRVQIIGAACGGNTSTGQAGQAGRSWVGYLTVTPGASMPVVIGAGTAAAANGLVSQGGATSFGGKNANGGAASGDGRGITFVPGAGDYGAANINGAGNNGAVIIEW